jgi:hypothetical protein
MWAGARGDLNVIVFGEAERRRERNLVGSLKSAVRCSQ